MFNFCKKTAATTATAAMSPIEAFLKARREYLDQLAGFASACDALVNAVTASEAFGALDARLATAYGVVESRFAGIDEVATSEVRKIEEMRRALRNASLRAREGDAREFAAFHHAQSAMAQAMKATPCG